MVNISIEDLKFKSEFGINCGKYQEGYRVVYIYPNDVYSVGTFCGSIEDFMMDFVKAEPIIDDNDIPPFISIDDILQRYLNDLKDIIAVAIYKTDGTCIQIKHRKKRH